MKKYRCYSIATVLFSVRALENYYFSFYINVFFLTFNSRCSLNRRWFWCNSFRCCYCLCCWDFFSWCWCWCWFLSCYWCFSWFLSCYWCWRFFSWYWRTFRCCWNTFCWWCRYCFGGLGTFCWRCFSNWSLKQINCCSVVQRNVKLKKKVSNLNVVQMITNYRQKISEKCISNNVAEWKWRLRVKIKITVTMY